MTRFAILLPLTLVACSSAPPLLPPTEAQALPVVARDVLDGRWSIAAVNGRALTGPSLVLDGRAARYQLACNSGGGASSRNGDKLFLTGAALTEMACEPARMQADSEIMAVLRLPMTMELTPPGRLRLINEAGTLDLVRQRG